MKKKFCLHPLEKKPQKGTLIGDKVTIIANTSRYYPMNQVSQRFNWRSFQRVLTRAFFFSVKGK